VTTPARIAVVGLGFMGAKWARAIASHPGAELATVCDRDRSRAVDVARELGTNWTADLGSALHETVVHGVVVCTPEHLHEEPTLAGIAAGCAVAVEKPFAHDLATAQRMVDASDRAGVPILAGHILRFEPRYAAVRRAIDEGRIGRVQAVRSERLGVLGDQKVLAGRTTIPLYYGVHELDLARWYAGEITSVFAQRSRGVLAAAGYDIDDLYSVVLGFAGGAHGTSMLGWSLPNAAAVNPGLSGFTVIGEEGYIRIDQGATGLHEVGADGPAVVDTWYAPDVHGRPRGALAIEVDHFVDVARGEATPLCTAIDGIEALRASLAVELAATEARAVAPSELGP
jgi:predicted dehydrogenase